MTSASHRSSSAALGLAALLAACGGGGDDNVGTVPQLDAGDQRQPDVELANTSPAFANTTITAANSIPAGSLTVAGSAVAAHCQVRGSMHQRTSTVDGKSYAIGFEMRLPLDWNGRFYYQANGGIDGSIVTATGAIGGARPPNALTQGFAVLSSDAGHAGARAPRSATTRRPGSTTATRRWGS